MTTTFDGKLLPWSEGKLLPELEQARVTKGRITRNTDSITLVFKAVQSPQLVELMGSYRPPSSSATFVPTRSSERYAGFLVGLKRDEPRLRSWGWSKVP
jgi:hypothetical protein